MTALARRRPTAALPCAAIALGLAALVALAGCDESPAARQSEPRTDASAAARPPVTHFRATLVLEPLQLMIGEVVTARITVVTPPEHRLLPFQPPEVAGVWLLDATTLDVARSETRWVHQTEIRLRTRDVGPLVWPAFQVVVEDFQGLQRSVDVSKREFEVVSMLQEFPDQMTPFGLRTREPARTRGSFWLGAGLGCAAALALAGLALAFYRARDRVPAESEATARSARARELTLWEWADSELAGAEAALDSPDGPRDAANRGARLLRQYVERRFNIQTEALTTEELSATKPPLAIDSRWPELVRILRRFDAERFRASPLEGAAVAGARDGSHSGIDSGIQNEIEAVKRFVADSTPRELRR